MKPHPAHFIAVMVFPCPAFILGQRFKEESHAAFGNRNSRLRAGPGLKIIKDFFAFRRGHLYIVYYKLILVFTVIMAYGYPYLLPFVCGKVNGRGLIFGNGCKITEFVAPDIQILFIPVMPGICGHIYSEMLRAVGIIHLTGIIEADGTSARHKRRYKPVVGMQVFTGHRAGY